MGKKRDALYQKTHDREKKTLDKLIRMIAKGFFWIVSVRIDKTGFGKQHRVTMFLNEKDDEK